jgi:hypothetical protein
MLVAIMIFSAFPFVSSAASEVISNTRTIAANTTIAAGDTWSVTSTGKIVINEGVTLTIASGASIINDGTIENKGKIVNNGSLIRQENSVIKHEVRFPGGRENQFTVYSLVDGIVLDPTNVGEYDPLYMTDPYNYDPVPSTTGYVHKVWVKEGAPFYFRLTLSEPAYDINKFVISANGMPLSYRVGTFLGTSSVSNSVDVVYGSGNGPVYGEHLRKIIRVSLPYQEAASDSAFSSGVYDVIAYYRGMNYTKEVEVLYGDSIVFAVRLDPTSDKSNYTVTVDGTKVEKSEEGFYSMSNITDTKANEIVVAGVMPNSTFDTFNRVIGFIKQIVETFMDIFNTLFGGGMFSGFGTLPVA